MKQADYECLNCEHKWSQSAGPTVCPRCGYEYVEWKNYKDDFERK